MRVVSTQLPTGYHLPAEMPVVSKNSNVIISLVESHLETGI
jgi:hypothetical protein